jgi:pyruvate dehydrogenase E1 component beta subunit
MQEATIEAIAEEMRRDPMVFMLGQTVGEFDEQYNPGMAKLNAEFGRKRMRPTAIVEKFEAGAGVGAALAGGRPIVDLTTAAFGVLAYDEIFAKAGLWMYEHGRNNGMKMPVVFRAPYTSYGSAGAEHSRSPLATYMHGLGFKLVIPSSPYATKGLLKTAIRDDDPVIFMEPRPLAMRRGPVPEEDYTLPFGQAEIVREGTDCTVVAVGYQLGMALEAAELLAKEGVSVEVIDPRTLIPLDMATIVQSVRKTGRLVETDEDFVRCGVGAEIAFQVQEQALDSLKAPIQRVAPRAPSPASPVLNREVMPSTEKITEAIRRTLTYQRQDALSAV